MDNAIQGQFDPFLVIVSVVVACIAAYTAFLFSERINSSEQKWHKLAWLTVGSWTLGFGIWAMHFTGMMAYSLPFDVVYDKLTTLISIIPAVLASAVIFFVSIFRLPFWWCMPLQSILMGSGIGAMHYIGMAAMRQDALMRYDPLIFTASIFVAVALSYVALQMKLWAERARHGSEIQSLIIAAICMGMAISAMHYTGMAAVFYFPVHADVTIIDLATSWVPDTVTNMVIYTVLAMLSLMIGAVHLSRRLELMRLLEASKTREANIVDNMVDGLIVINSAGMIDAYNKAAENMFGYKMYEIIGRNVSTLMAGSDRERHDKYMHRYSSSQTSDVIGIGREIVGRRKNGEVFPVEIALSKFNVDDEVFFSGIVRDISDRKEVERKVIEARRIAEVASHAKSEFLNRVSHELRTPMNVIMGFSQLLESDAEQFNEEQRGYIHELKQASQQLLKLIDGMLELSSFETHKLDLDLDAVLLSDLINASVADVLPEAEQAGIKIHNLLDDRTLVVMTDVGRLQQVLHHILSNAITHNKPGGEVSIACETLNDNRIRISVTDTGPGISEDKQSRLFAAFERLNNDERIKGTGMGLAISKHLVEMMNGSIGVESRPGVGSTFWIELDSYVEEGQVVKQTPAQH
ncbi:MAG: PAS domain S-box protein [Gammaproteobacteria bacterium]|nr:PAS domain S-box protein [Gammaproteobacteria bacterium]